MINYLKELWNFSIQRCRFTYYWFIVHNIKPIWLRYRDTDLIIDILAQDENIFLFASSKEFFIVRRMDTGEKMIILVEELKHYTRYKPPRLKRILLGL